MLIWKQTLEASHDSDPLLLNGSCVRVLDSADLFWSGSGPQERESTWSFQLRSKGGWAGNRYSRDGGRFRLEETFGVASEDPFQDLEPGTMWSLKSDGSYMLNAPEHGDQRISLMFEVGPTRLGYGLMLLNSVYFSDGHEVDSASVADVLHLPGLRGTPERFYGVTRVGHHFPGPFTPHAASVLVSWQEKHDPRTHLVGQDLQTLGLTWKVDAKRLDDSRVQLKVGRLPKPNGSNDLVDIADVGFGASHSW